MDITTLANKLNAAAGTFRIGSLQQVREEIGKHPRTKKIFTKSTINVEGEWAFHDGGRRGLQFNIGIDQDPELPGERCWRHCVAFSFEPSQTLPNPGILRPKVFRFNTWVQSNLDLLDGFTMWYWDKSGGRSQNRLPAEITADELDHFLKTKAFLSLGSLVPEAELDVDRILRDFDRLLPLFEHVEGEDVPEAAEIDSTRYQRKVSDITRTTALRIAEVVEVRLRHNLLQAVLVDLLRLEFPNQSVHLELPVHGGRRVDAAVETSDGFIFCELKVAPDVRTAVRSAIGQLLEYSHWPEAHRAKKWWIIGEAAPTADDIDYLKLLRAKYGLPVFYRRIDIGRIILRPEQDF